MMAIMDWVHMASTWCILGLGHRAKPGNHLVYIKTIICYIMMNSENQCLTYWIIVKCS